MQRETIEHIVQERHLIVQPKLQQIVGPVGGDRYAYHHKYGDAQDCWYRFDISWGQSYNVNNVCARLWCRRFCGRVVHNCSHYSKRRGFPRNDWRGGASELAVGPVHDSCRGLVTRERLANWTHTARWIALCPDCRWNRCYARTLLCPQFVNCPLLLYS